jgi:uncharacterized RDD family membrane protein YckC
VTGQRAPALSIDSATGIDVSLPLAGPGARAYAFVIDWLIRLIVATSWYVVGAIIYNRGMSLNPPLNNSGPWFALIVLPALAIYFLYHPLVESVTRGRTPGKRRAGIRIVSRQGGPPSTGALLVRNVFRLVDSLPGFYGVGLGVMMFSDESVRVGDMAAGTVLVYEHGLSDEALPQAAALRLGTLDPQGAEIAADLIVRWPALEPAARIRLTRELVLRYLGEQADLTDGDELQWRSRLERLARPRA